jgi:hypothetical protein
MIFLPSNAILHDTESPRASALPEALGFVAHFPWRGLRVRAPAVTQGATRGRATMAIRVKGAHGPPDSLRLGGRWSGASP